MVSEQNTQLTDDEIAQAAYKAGFRGSQIGVITAITLAESGGQTHPKDNCTQYGCARGPLQILSIHTDFTGNPYDINDAMGYAKVLFERAGGNYTPWEAYTVGTYQQFTTRGRTAQRKLNEPESGPAGLGTVGQDIGESAPAQAAGGLLSGINAVGDFFNNLRQPQTLQRLAAGWLGLFAIGLGILIIAWPAVTGGAKVAAAAP